MTDTNALVLEILKQGNGLGLSIFAQSELASTLRHFSQLAVSFTEIDKLCQEVTSILNKALKLGAQDTDLINALKKIGQLLWDQLLTKPVKDRLKAAPTLDLILSLDEELIHIPWELLYDGENFLCLKFNSGRLVRTRQKESPLPQYRSLTTKPKMLILTNPTDDLKSAYLEGVSIKNQFERRRNEVSIDFKSTNIDTLYVKKNLRDYDIIHFAGHCEYDPDNPKNSGWVLKDGKFSTQDILMLSESLSLPTLVFSNACHSAQTLNYVMELDYQEKTYSLAAAFLFSGVRHYIGAIWKIQDAVSLTFAKEFYSHLINGGSVGVALRLSRLKLIKEYGLNSIWWANYLLYGDPNFIIFKAKAKPPIRKLRKSISLSRKSIFKFSLAVATISICIYLYIWLPTINPSTYFLYAKSRRLFLQGKNAEAILICNQLIKKDAKFLAAYPLLADTFHRLGDNDNALKYYFAYALNCEKRNDTKHLASAYLGIGWIYHLQGEYPKAFDFYHKTIALSSETKDKLSEARALERLAVWFIDKQDYDRALELLMKSSDINRERQHIYEHRYGLACDYFDIGLIFTNKDDYVTAREFYSKSRLLFERLKLKHELSDCYFNLGEICLYEKKYQEALGFYRKGLAIDEQLGNKRNLASDYNMIGELYIEMDDLEEAEKLFQQSVLLSQQINAQPELACAYHNLGLLYKNKNKKNKAREYFRQAQEIYRLIDTPDYQNIKKELLELSNS